IFLPDIDGWRVLDRLKNDLITRHIPVCVISTDESRERALQGGALAFVAKPIQNKGILDGALAHLTDYIHRAERRALIVEPDAGRRESLLSLLAGCGAEPVAVED